MFGILASSLLEKYISQFKMQDKPFRYTLLQSIPYEIDKSYFIDMEDTKKTQEYQGSHITNLIIKSSPTLSYEFLQEKDKELQIYFPSITIGLCVIDHYHVTEKVLMFEKSKEVDIERLFHYEFKDIYWSVPLKRETLELFTEKITFAIYDYMEDLARDIMNGEVRSVEGFVLQLEELQVDTIFDDGYLLFQP